MTIKQAIEKAIEGGYVLPGDRNVVINLNARRFGERRAKHMYICSIFLDPLFWQSLGKALGWREEYPEAGKRIGTFIEWKQMWHRFIDHLAEGKDAESFFANL